MSIIANGIAYRHSGSSPLFEQITLSVPDGAKIALIGPNGAGKSTRLQLLAGRLVPAAGSVAASSQPYYIPQHIAPDGRSVARLLGLSDKLRALRAICAGSADPAHFDTPGDDWTIEERSRAAPEAWGLGKVGLDTPLVVSHDDGSVRQIGADRIVGLPETPGLGSQPRVRPQPSECGNTSR